MANFWLTKEMVIEALKLSEGAQKETMIGFDGSSKVIGDKEYTIMEIYTCGKKKTVKQEFKKIAL